MSILNKQKQNKNKKRKKKKKKKKKKKNLLERQNGLTLKFTSVCNWSIPF